MIGQAVVTPPIMRPTTQVTRQAVPGPGAPLMQPRIEATEDPGIVPLRIPRTFGPALTLYNGLKQYGYKDAWQGLGGALRFGPRMRPTPQRGIDSLRLNASGARSGDRVYVPAAYVGQARPTPIGLGY